jgi:FtsH-binding integral membrane protein
MFVGVGAARVRDLFNQAEKVAPSIIFIDEIDGIGQKRGGEMVANDEREQTLNQLLSEMDGFDMSVGIVVLAATNRPEILDPALMRPRRFDRQVTIPLPNLAERLAILKVHCLNKHLDPDVELEVFARGTPGFSGADLANLANEAAIVAVRNDRDVIEASDFGTARDRVILGQREGSNVLLPEEKHAVAVHESGHALVAAYSAHADPVSKVTILPAGQALGVTEQLPIDDRHLYGEDYLNDSLAVRMGGRAGELVELGQGSTGASNAPCGRDRPRRADGPRVRPVGQARPDRLSRGRLRLLGRRGPGVLLTALRRGDPGQDRRRGAGAPAGGRESRRRHLDKAPRAAAPARRAARRQGERRRGRGLPHRRRRTTLRRRHAWRVGARARQPRFRDSNRRAVALGAGPRQALLSRAVAGPGRARPSGRSERGQAMSTHDTIKDELLGSDRSSDSATLFGATMGLVAITVGVFALGAYLGRDLTNGWGWAFYFVSLGLLVGMRFAVRTSSGASTALLFAFGLTMGLATGPTVAYYAATNPKSVWEAAGATALFMAGLGSIGYATRADLSTLGRIAFWALLGLVIFGVVMIFVQIPNGDLIYSVLGLVIFAALTVVDFQRLRARTDLDSAPLLAASIFIDALNVFLFFLNLFNRRD